jgi:hypothetical protein
MERGIMSSQLVPISVEPLSEDVEYLDIEVPIKREELLLLCIDVSPSMSGPASSDPNWSKANEVYKHIVSDRDGLLKRLNSSSNRQAYYLGAVLFTERVERISIDKMVKDDDTVLLAPPEAAFSPRGSGTAIGDALAAAGEMAQRWIGDGGGRERIATILVLTDGGNNSGKDPRTVAEGIKKGARHLGHINRDAITIATAAYGLGADKQLMSDIASPDRNLGGKPMFEVVESGEQLRDFLIRSLRNM